MLRINKSLISRSIGILILLIAFAFSACSSSSGGSSGKNEITIVTAKQGEVKFEFVGTDGAKLAIDWGVGDENDVINLASAGVEASKNYSSSDQKTITITGEILHITDLILSDNEITSIDLSACSGLENLRLVEDPSWDAGLVSLDLSQNLKLKDLYIVSLSELASLRS